MRLDRPWWLAAVIPAMTIAFLAYRYGGRTVPRRQHRWALAARLAGVFLLVAAAAQPIVVRSVTDRSVMFLLDRSASISAAARDDQLAFVAAALDEAGTEVRTAVAVFGADLKLDSSFTLDRGSIAVQTTVDEAATDLATALRGAAALMPSEGSRRVVVLTDMVTTTGDARAAARELADQGIAVDVIVLSSNRSLDALVESVRLPAAARLGDSVPVGVVVRSNLAGPAELVVRSGQGRDEVIPIQLESGTNRIEVEVTADRAGFLPVSVEVRSAQDTRHENDRAEGITRVLGPARVAVVEGVAGEADELSRALEAGGLEVDLRAGIPDAEELLEYDAVILVNVDRPNNEEGEALAGYVEQLGRGLLVVGGDRAFGLGDYFETPLESVLPVSTNPDDIVRRQPVAEVLVIDSSGSMGACHCNGTSGIDGGVVKTDIAKAGAALAIEALTNSDQVGVLAFAGGSDWVIPLGPKPDPESAREALGTISPNGDTEISRALEVALEELRGASESLRHIVLFTDGWDPNDANLLPMARKIADEGVTLSVLGTGEGPGAALQRMAELGGGRYYPGTDLESVPEVFVEETLIVARNLATEGSFFPILASPSPITAELQSSPPLLGYVLTKAKGSAAVLLEVGQGDPLLATWQRGLGRATAWTSDATARWSSQWVDWEGYVDFWGRVVRDLLPAGREVPPEVFVDRGELRVRLDLPSAEVDSNATARVRLPSGETTVLPMQRVSGTIFEASMRATSPGAYWVGVTVDNPDGSMLTTSSGAVSSYQEEFAFRDPDPTLGADIAAITGGRAGPFPEQVLDPAPVRGRAEVPVWPWLAGAALALFLIDVGLRRLVFTAGDVDAWKEGFTSRRTRERRRIEQVREEAATAGAPPPVVSDSETLQRLMRRKRL
jgi:uncharacterized membrane protein